MMSSRRLMRKRLAEAWDVDLDKLASLANANRKDVSQATHYQPSAYGLQRLGYYLEELLELESARYRKGSKFLYAERGGAWQPAGDPCRQTTIRYFGYECIPQVADEPSHRWRRFVVSCARPTRCLSKVEDQWQQLVASGSACGGPRRFVCESVEHVGSASQLRLISSGDSEPTKHCSGTWRISGREISAASSRCIL